MSAGDTLTSVCSTALFHLGAAPLSSYENPRTPLEQQITGQYQTVLNGELRKRAWTFAIKRTSFSDAEAPAIPPAFNTWALPGDCLRVLREHRASRFHFEPTWWLEGRNVCDFSAKAPLIRYITNAVTPDDYDPSFVEAFTLKLAFRCCEYATQSSQKKNDLANDYSAAIAEASKQNAWEKPEGTTHAPDEAFSWLRDRDNYLA